MFFENWLFQLIGLLPQSIAIVALGTAIVKERYSYKQIILAGLLITLLGFIVYYIPLNYGLHVPLNIIIVIFVLRFALNLNILKSAMASLLSFITLIIIELLVYLAQLRVFGISEDFFPTANDLQKFLIALPTLLILVLVSITFQVIRRRQYRTR